MTYQVFRLLTVQMVGNGQAMSKPNDANL